MTMNSQHATIEIIAPTINEAIEKGLAELELSREAVDIEILDEGSRGLFGLGSHQARVRLIVKQNVPTTSKSDMTSSLGRFNLQRSVRGRGNDQTCPHSGGKCKGADPSARCPGNSERAAGEDAH